MLKIVRDGRFLAVIADREYRAVKAAAALAASARWTMPDDLPANLAPADLVRRLPSRATTILDRGPGAAAGPTLRAAYSRPFQLHASIGPSCAVARLDDGRYTVWTHSQGVYPLRAALAEMLGVAEDEIHCIHVEGAGCYGHNAADDAAADAVLLARAYPGRPVRVQWMREDEHGWKPFGPPMLAEAEAALGAAGKIARWRYDVWSPPHNARPGKAGADHSPDGSTFGRSQKMRGIHRLESKLLVLGVEQRHDVRERRAGLHRDDQLVRLIGGHGVQRRQVEHGVGRHHLADQPLRSMANDLKRLLAGNGRPNRLFDVLGVCYSRIVHGFSA